MRQLDASHPMFAGHFPGNPLVPGAYLLAIVIEDARARLRERSAPHEPVGIRAVKFLQPVRPGQPFCCDFDPVDEQAWRFTIRSDAVRIAVGTLLLGSRGPAAEIPGTDAPAPYPSADHDSQR